MSLALILAIQAARRPPPPSSRSPSTLPACLGPAAASRTAAAAPTIRRRSSSAGGAPPAAATIRSSNGRGSYAVRPLRAERDLGGGAVLGVHSEAVEIAPGMVSNRVMLGLGIRF